MSRSELLSVVRDFLKNNIFKIQGRYGDLNRVWFLFEVPQNVIPAFIGMTFYNELFYNNFMACRSQ
ncbi:Uncharacterized protein dnm_062960 [Desulfonema magnum]|uniref:Uncharacterized protein n=1 Tax=Desulfonema magnum TaxID=45655 RepID=A0A975BS64_9BACT|nr:Uncharacterized protein dnm_062960 [Desulfonema magnum]